MRPSDLGPHLRTVRLLFSMTFLMPVVLLGADTLRFQSTAFGTERMVIVHTPTYFKAASPAVAMPVLIVLDGQHEWFVEPVVNDIRYLQYTHEVPQALVVVVPHADRVKEAAGVDQQAMLTLLTEELPRLLEPYHPGDYRVLVGHSFTASFALEAKVLDPDAFDAVIALSPLNRVERTLPALAELLNHRPDDDVLLAVGGTERTKDGGHHASLMAVWNALPAAMGSMSIREFPSAGHTSLPIIAFPELLSTLFMAFSLRDSLAPVNDEYQLCGPPPSPVELMAQVDRSLIFRGKRLPWEVPEINGLASRLWTGGMTDHVLAIYRRGAELYPDEYSMQWSLGEVLLERDRPAGEAALRKALQLLDTEMMSGSERSQLKAEIQALFR